MDNHHGGIHIANHHGQLEHWQWLVRDSKIRPQNVVKLFQHHTGTIHIICKQRLSCFDMICSLLILTSDRQASLNDTLNSARAFFQQNYRHVIKMNHVLFSGFFRPISVTFDINLS